MSDLLLSGTRLIVGAAIWVALVALHFSGAVVLGEIPLLFLLAPLVIVPLGLDLIRAYAPAEGNGAAFDLARSFSFVGAILAVLSIFVPTGKTSAGFASGWLLICLLLTISALRRAAHGSLRSLEGACATAALLYLPIGGAWLLASRLGMSPMGFTEPIVLLTAVHFHYAGFAAPLLALATSRSVRSRSGWSRAALTPIVWGVLAGPAMLAAGFVVGPEMKLAAALMVAGSEIALGLLTLIVLRSVPSVFSRALLAISSAAALFGMVLAARWALGEYPRQPFLDLARMARFHGATNAFGFVLCGLLGWRFGLARQHG